MISTPYLLPGEQLTSALLEATQRGVRVRVLIPSVENGSGVEFVTQASQRDAFGPLLDGGVQLHEYAPALLHTKMMIIDGVWATVGSTNFDNRSMAMNDELNVMFYDQSIAKRLEEIFVEDVAHSTKLTREQLENREWLHRALSVLLSPFHAWF
jgi:cardiolipin synthase